MCRIKAAKPGLAYEIASFKGMKMIYGANVRGHAYGISNSRDILFSSKYRANFPKTRSTLDQEGRDIVIMQKFYFFVIIRVVNLFLYFVLVLWEKK